MQVTKTELMDAIKANTETKFTKPEINDIFDTAMDEIRKQILQGNEVTLPGLGRFKMAIKPARECRNPKTGEMVEVEEHATVRFKMSVPLTMEVRKLDLDNFRQDDKPAKTEQKAKPKEKNNKKPKKK